MSAPRALKHLLVRVAAWVLGVAALPVLALVARRSRGRGRALLWGPIPIINNRYWSRAMREAGWESRTLVGSYYASINRREDYDLYFDQLVPAWIRPAGLRALLGPYLALAHVVRSARVLHIPFSGGPLGETLLWRWEARLLRLAGVRTVVLPYGSDVFMYSRITDYSVRSALLSSYPAAAAREPEVTRRVEYWTRHADVVVMGFTMDGVPRWDVPVGNMLSIDVEQWAPRSAYSRGDGRSGCVRVLHAPNHRALKGTEFITRAVEELRAEGLDVELVLLERVQNHRVQEVMREVDILADQLILPGYGMNAVEGMACGLPVLANLTDEAYSRVFRRYSHLGECPVVPTSPESVKANLRALVTDPALRESLGRAGRAFVLNFHSPDAARFLFGSIYRRLEGEEVDLMNLFHPLKSEYLRPVPGVENPLVEGRLPGASVTPGTFHATSAPRE